MSTVVAEVAVACLVCGAPCGDPVYRHDGTASITSTAQTVARPTVVYVCERCGHVQTPPLDDAAEYYANGYGVHLESDRADDLYAVRHGVPIYRAQHQANAALAKLELPRGASVLDFGCGKAMTLRALLAARPDLDGAAFDVSDAYRDAWKAFIAPHNQATYDMPPGWNGRFDAVLSFFALEHAIDPRAFLTAIRRVLRPGGTLHLTVPNLRRNAGDFIVVDHVNHFMPSSLRRLFAATGFTNVRIDEEAHDAAFVVNARRSVGDLDGGPAVTERSVAAYVGEARRCAAYWSAAGDAVERFEREVARGRAAAIYGSGFYGVFIAGRLRNRMNVGYFLDRNPHQQAKRIFGLRVLPPEALGDQIDVVYLGLNPARAPAIAAGIEPLHRRPRDIFYL
ncbi:MAG TPA: class I SAM-dependent methyltransferase [Candidatus Elarobacter sp.]|nr:class I SAM-dependent methyltransferase [Candidatus Elarobacter sp.]